MKQLTKLRNLIQDNPDAVKCLNEFEDHMNNCRSHINTHPLAGYFDLGIMFGLSFALNMEVQDEL